MTAVTDSSNTITPPVTDPVPDPAADPTMGFHPIGMAETPMVEVPMVEVPMVEVPMVEVPMVEAADTMEAEMTSPVMRTMRRTMRTTPMNEGDERAALAQISQVGNLINARNVLGAIRAFREASRVLGQNHSSVRSAKADLAQRGPIAAGNAAYAGNCTQATQILRGLRAVGIRVGSDYLGDACD